MYICFYLAYVCVYECMGIFDYLKCVDLCSFQLFYTLADVMEVCNVLIIIKISKYQYLNKNIKIS